MSNELNMIRNRYDFMLFFDVQDGNPNGDPDAGNMPRIDPETGQGLVTDVCLKRKVRNYVQLARAKQDGYDIFIKEKAVLNTLIDAAYEKEGIDLTAAPKDEKDGKKRTAPGKGQGSEVESARMRMCRTYYDVRTFGAVMMTGANAGQVRGPVQLTFARSVDPIAALEHSITRCAVATEDEAEKQGGDNRTMGRKNTVPYALYCAHGFVSPSLAAQTGFDSDDLALLWEALKNMFEHDHSAARGMMSTCKLIVFKHDSALGNASSGTLFSLIHVKKKDSVSVPRSFADYELTIEDDKLPKGVEILPN
ncbi:MAG: type I-C CRISPR-associated protein Cas7/Csd2 [Thermoguttaceae bacterium]|nr:type I-C CRISPR-associated protein Cas7/Csd2 [Thermoguttaceae bacterium]